ncbi:MAG: HAMP domain-containing protein [Ruminococcus sp.]|nr:HAMP domain-containing protein [Ruminococcus sp.]
MKTIRVKLMLVMLSVAFVIIVVLNFVSIRAIDDTAEETLMNSARPLAMQSSNNFNITIWQYMQNLSQNARSSEFSDTTQDKERLDILATGFSDNVKKYISFSVYNPNATVKYTTDEKKATIVKKTDIDNALSLGSGYVTDLTERKDDENSEKRYFSILQSVQVEGKKLIAGANIDADIFTDILDSSATGTNGYGFLVAGDGTVLLHSSTKKLTNGLNLISRGEEDSKAKPMGDAVKNITEKADTSGTFNDDGEKYIYGSSKTEYFDGTLVYIMNIDDFNGNGDKAMRYIVIIGGIMMLATLVVSIIYSTRISKPITSATKRIRQLAQGNLSAPVDVWYSKDELGVLTSSLEETIVCLRQYINLITVALTQISDGNLCHRMEGTFKGDFQQIKNSFNEILENLSDTFASINTAAEQVNTGAVQVSNSAQSVSQGSTQQASAIEELSVTLKDVAVQVEQNAQDAKNAYHIVEHNTESIGRCNEDMTNMLSAINAIHTSSAEISKIIKVIDEIAFQTNILALNAAVEAAREGSKGFGVVADEVRRLASRSADAAKQTASLIENSSAAVSRGTDIAEQTAASLKSIVESSNEIQGLVRNISEKSETQTVAIAQINTGLDQISDVVSANTASSVGTASASEELSSQSLILKNMIARFRLDTEGVGRQNTFRYEYKSDFEDEENSANSFDSGMDNDDDPFMSSSSSGGGADGGNPLSKLSKLKFRDYTRTADDDEDDMNFLRKEGLEYSDDAADSSVFTGDDDDKY